MMKLMKIIKVIKISSDLRYFAPIIIISVILALMVDESKSMMILDFLPTILGILFSGVLASLAIILALLSSNEMSIISSLENGYSKYIEFLTNSKKDILIVFMCTVASIFIAILANVKFPQLMQTFLFENLFFISLQFKIQFFLMLDFIGLFLSVFAIFDIIESIFTLSELRYQASEKNNSILLIKTLPTSPPSPSHEHSE